jgi:hypothetical protein
VLGKSSGAFGATSVRTLFISSAVHSSRCSGSPEGGRHGQPLLRYKDAPHCCRETWRMHRHLRPLRGAEMQHACARAWQQCCCCVWVGWAMAHVRMSRPRGVKLCMLVHKRGTRACRILASRLRAGSQPQARHKASKIGQPRRTCGGRLRGVCSSQAEFAVGAWSLLGGFVLSTHACIPCVSLMLCLVYEQAH